MIPTQQKGPQQKKSTTPQKTKQQTPHENNNSTEKAPKQQKLLAHQPSITRCQHGKTIPTVLYNKKDADVVK